jgi:hypothetical protein
VLDARPLPVRTMAIVVDDVLARLQSLARIRARRNGQPVEGAWNRELQHAAGRFLAVCEDLRQAEAALARAQAQVQALDAWERGVE